MSPTNALIGLLSMLLIAPGVQGVFVVKPNNTAAVKGTSAQLICQGELADFGAFFERSTISDAYNYQPIPTQDPRINHDLDFANFQRTLTINNVMPEDAGIYECTLVQSNLKAYAQLVVLDTDTECTSSKSLSSLGDGENVITSCTLKLYSAIGYVPDMTWSHSPGGSLTPTENSNSSFINSVLSEAVSCAYNGRQYVVDTVFPTFDTSLLSGSAMDHATLPALYTYRYTSPSMVIFCQLNNVYITPEKGTYDAGETLICSSDGQAPITYGWTGDAIVSGQRYTIPSSMRGRRGVVLTCTGTQEFNGNTYTASKAIQFSVRSRVNHAEGRPHLMMTTLVGSFFFHLILYLMTFYN